MLALRINPSRPVPPAAPTSQLSPNIVNFVDNFCIAATITIPNNDQQTLFVRTNGEENFAVLGVSSTTVFFALDTASGGVTFPLTDISPSDFSHIQICVENGRATLYVNCTAVGTRDITIQSAQGDRLIFYQSNITNPVDRFQVKSHILFLAACTS